MKAWIAALAAVSLAACGQKPEPEAPAAEAPANAPEALVTDSWIGRWTGPEGLFLEIRSARPGSGEYQMTIKDTLDAQADYVGKAEGEGIAFTRAGHPLTIRAGMGADTGFKYLAGKRDCLVVVQDTEGYCRD